MTNVFFYVPQRLVVVRHATQVSTRELYQAIRRWQESEEGIVFSDVAQRSGSHPILGGESTEEVVVFHDQWRLRFEPSPQAKGFRLYRVVDGVISSKGGYPPYYEEDDEFIQNLARMHNKFDRMPSSQQLAIDYNRLSERSDRDLAISLAYFDIDRFKRFNDSYTETQVDQTLLPQFHSFLLDSYSQRACVYLEGGDEFIALLPGHELSRACRFCEELRSAVESLAIDIHGTQESLTVSIGVVQRKAGEDLGSLQGRANQNKALAKKEGRNRVACFADAGGS